jgi:hypothetical protein
MAKERMKSKSTPGCTGTSANVTLLPIAPMYSRNSGRPDDGGAQLAAAAAVEAATTTSAAAAITRLREAMTTTVGSEVSRRWLEMKKHELTWGFPTHI